MAVRERPLAPRLLFIAAILSICGAGHAGGSASGAASSAAGEDPAGVGATCRVDAPVWAPPSATAEDLPWASVWLGHFSGGRPYKDPFGLKLIDWLDEKVCFPSQRACQDWIARLRRTYHRPEGYWTCFLLR